MTATLLDLDRLALAEAVRTRLAEQIDGMTINTSEDPGNIYLGEPVGKVAADGDGYASKYLAVFPSPGTPSLEQDMARTGIDLDWLVQITCAGGWVEDVLEEIADVHAALYRWEPTVPGLSCGPLEPPPGFDPGSVRYDRDVVPHRPFIALQYANRNTAT